MNKRGGRAIEGGHFFFFFFASLLSINSKCNYRLISIIEINDDASAPFIVADYNTHTIKFCLAFFLRQKMTKKTTCTTFPGGDGQADHYYKTLARLSPLRLELQHHDATLSLFLPIVDSG